jgi:hypothetical protein
MQRVSFKSLLAHGAVALALAGPASAQAPATQRALNNASTALSSVEIDPQLITQPIADRDKDKVSRVLLPNIDNALARAERNLEGLAPADQALPEVQELVKRLAEVRAYRDALRKNATATSENKAALMASYRAFRDEAKPFAAALALFPQASGSAQVFAGQVTPALLTAALTSLGQLDTLCTTKYAGITLDDNLAFQLAFNPIAICKTAHDRQELAAAMVRGMVTRDLVGAIKTIQETTKGLEGRDGMLSLGGNFLEEMFEDPAKGKATLLARYQPLAAAVGIALPADLMAPLDQALADLGTEIDRLAPTYSFPAKSYPAGGAASGLRGVLANGITVIKAAYLYPEATIAKNEIDIPTEKYRSGAALLKVPKKKWCVYRGFTLHQPYAGGGKYQSPGTYTLEFRRFQSCK